MAAQEFAALAIVAVTAGIFAWRLLRPRQFHSRKGSACGCPGSSSAPPTERIIFKARKGQTPQILITSR
jgi:hypothetical protein